VSAEEIRPRLLAGFPWHTPGVPHTHLGTAEKWWNALDPVFERAFVAAGLDDAQSLAKLVRTHYPNADQWRLFDDAVPALDVLSSYGWTHAMLSNHAPELVDIVRGLGIDARFAHIINSATTGYEKPDPRAIRPVLEKYSGAEKMWMIGDSMKADVGIANAVGIAHVLVRRHHPDAVRYCDDLVGLPAVIRGSGG